MRLPLPKNKQDIVRLAVPPRLYHSTTQNAS